MGESRVWLVVEFNCYYSQPNHVSVWDSGRPLSSDRELADDVAQKLVGPIPLAEDERMVGVLRDQLQAAAGRGHHRVRRRRLSVWS